MKNILLLNAGTRNRLIQDFRKSIGGEARIIATDSYFLAPALYDADKYYVTSRWDGEKYWESIFEICKKENVGLVLSLVDPELELLAARKEKFEKQGILVNSADKETVHNCFDKFKMLQFLKTKGYPWIKTYRSFAEVKAALDLKEEKMPLFVKPVCGSGSAGIEKVDNIIRLQEICNARKDIVIQEYMEADELGVDVYVDLVSGRVVSIFAKKKLKMRAGETDKSVSYKNEKLFNLIEKFAEEFGLRGVNDIDVFERNGEFYISEVNPRFGGGYLHAYECGEDFPKYLFYNMNGMTNKYAVGNYNEGVYMMKYFDIKMLEETKERDGRNDNSI